MVGNQTLTREELLEKRRISQKLKRDKIKLNPEKYARHKEKERQRYYKRKEAKKVKQINDMTPKEKRNQRKKWITNSGNFRNKQQSQLEMTQRPAESINRDNDVTVETSVYTKAKRSDRSPIVLNERYEIVGFNITVTVVSEISNPSDSLDNDILSRIQ